MNRVFFIDFDGTITKKDTCAAMVEAFAAEGWREINEMWENREISTGECAGRTFRLFRATPDDLRSLLETIEIDGGFKSFVDFCRRKDYPIFVVSDGYDFCIDYIFKKYGLDLTYFANKLVYQNGFGITCPHHNRDCGRCGTCKSALMKRLADPGSQTVYVGDGVSDICPAGHSRLVFAKGRLLQHCREKGIPAVPVTGFDQVLDWLRGE